MKVEILRSITKVKITQVKNLDLINVYIDNIKKGSGRILIECYGEVWSYYWGAMGDRTIEQFMIDTDSDYILNKLIGHNKVTLMEREYLARIIKAVIKALEEHSNV